MEDLTEHVTYLARQREKLRQRLAHHGKRGWANKAKLINTGETALGAAIAGTIQGHAGEGGAHVLGMPLSLVAGGALVAAGIFEAAGKHSEHLTSLGNGVLSEFFANWGYGVGQRWKEEGHFSLSSLRGGQGALGSGKPTTSSGDLSPHDMAAIVNNLKA